MLKRLQAASGMVFAVFLSVHLVNTWLAGLGAEVYDGFQQLVRTVYQFAPVEALLLAALMVHIVVGFLRIWQEPKRVLNWRGRLHRYAGFFLVLVIAGHIMAVRGASWFYDVWPEFSGLAFSIEALPGYFYPYYFLLGMAGFYHGMNGVGIALKRFGVNFTIGSAPLRYLTGAAAVLMVAALLGFGGFWFDVGDPSQSKSALLAKELFGEFAP